MIFNIHESGKIAIDKMFEKSNSKDKSFRIYIRRISAWLGPVFDVVLDEPSDKDEIFEADGYKIIIDDTIENIVIDDLPTENNLKRITTF